MLFLKKYLFDYMTHLYLVRHGETLENQQQILQGCMPGHLSETGMKQAEELKHKLRQSGIKFDIMLVSDLKRTLDTAAIVNQALHLSLIPCRLLRERDWGSYTGIAISIAKRTPIPNDAESVEHMFMRAKLFLKYVEDYFYGKTVLAIGHGLFNRTIQACLSECAIKDVPRINNCEIRHLQFEHLPDNWKGNDEQVVSAD